MATSLKREHHLLILQSAFLILITVQKVSETKKHTRLPIMSEENGTTKSNSQSESSSSSPTHSPFFQEHSTKDQQDENRTDLTLFGSKAPTTIIRSGTVRRVRSVTLKKEMSLGYSSGTISELNITSVRSDRGSSPSEQSINRSKFRRSLDSSLRHSLESISENKPKRSSSPTYPLSSSSKYSSSLESFSSDQTDYAVRSETNEAKDGRTFQSPASSYLSWIESINSAYFGNNNSIEPQSNVDIDSKVGEWNNFWLNYSNENARKRYLSSPYRSADEKTFQGNDDPQVSGSSTTQKEINDRNPTEYVSLTLEEIHEAMKCSNRITEIMQNALTRSEHECDMYIENSVYSETHSSSRNNSSLKEENIKAFREDMMNVSRERSYSYIMNAQDLIKQKESLKPAMQSSSTSCINALLNTGVADILKRVINKRRDVMTPDDLSSMTRKSFSEWSNK